MAKTKRNIALVCPGGRISRDLAKELGKIAADHCGDRVALNFHPQCFLEAGHFAGTDEARSTAFLEVANDDAYDAVWFARGGYGAIRLDDGLYAKLNKHARQKTYFGYSDNGAVMARLFAMGFEKVVHGPIAVDLARKDGHAAMRRALDYLVFDSKDGLEPAAMKQPCLAFNITVLAHIIGMSWAPDFSGRVVMLEDVGEYLYRIDRALAAIMLSPNMSGAAGLMLGRVCDIPENDRAFGASEEEIAEFWCARAGVPYLGRADIGHDAMNKIVPFGPPKNV
jgi:muramoyltetrapeptide carboxypeptidase